MEAQMNRVFKDSETQAAFDRQGYIIMNLLSPAQVNQVLQHAKKMSLPDHKGYGFNVAMDNPSYELRQEIHGFLTTLMKPVADDFLVNRKPYSTSYMIKEPGSGLVPAHQDWSYTDESKAASIMCWVALEDVSADNGAMGFIPGSHEYFDYRRVFPFPFAQTPVEQHKLQLMSYLELEPMTAGQVVFFNNKTIHGSFPNYGKNRRYAFCMSFALRDEPIYHFQFSDENNLNLIHQYTVEDDFFVEHNNESLTKVLKVHNGHLKEGTRIGAEPYILPELDWTDWQMLLRQQKRSSSSVLEARLENYLNRKA